MTVHSSSSDVPSVEAAFPDVEGLAGRITSLLDRLRPISDVEGMLHRMYLSPAHHRANVVVSEMMTEAGMAVRVDALGSVVGRYEGDGTDPRTLVIGSHVDSVVDGGHFDGPLGVVSGIVVVEALHRLGVRLPFAIDVYAFGDEENVRFPTHLSTSSALAGTYRRDWLDGRDADGVPMGEALVSFGGRPDDIAALARRPSDLVGYLEVHIEQGPILELENIPVGVVTAINGMTKAKATISGVAGHAGTVPMGRRTDALVAFADVVAAVSKMAAEFPDAVATIGSVDVQPGAANVIPGKVVFTLDIRAPDNRVRADLVAAITRVIDAVCHRHGASNTIEIVAENPATPMDGGLAGKLGEAVAAEGIALRKLPSGAGHDAISLAAVTPVAMLFVRCVEGISHNPAEDVDPIDAARAVRVLYRTVRDLASDSPRPSR